MKAFFHLFCPGGTLAGTWRQIWHEMMADFEDSGLVEAGCMMRMGVICSEEDKEEITRRLPQYPFIEQVEFFEMSKNDELYEGATLRMLWDYCQLHEMRQAAKSVTTQRTSEQVLYFHSKASVTANRCTIHHRRFMSHFVIKRWNLGMGAVMDSFYPASERLERGADIAGCEWRHAGGWHFSGNFWWARSDYIASLMDPMTDCAGFGKGYYHAGPEGGDNSRIKFEMWVGSGNPKVCELYNSGGLNWYTHCLTAKQYKERRVKWN